jgi:hypothetical protein
MAPVTVSVVPALNFNDGTFGEDVLFIVIEATVNVPAGSVGIALLELIVTLVVGPGTPVGDQFAATDQFVLEVLIQVLWQ